MRSINLNLEKTPSSHKRSLIIHDDSLYAIGGSTAIISSIPLSETSSSADADADTVARLSHVMDDVVNALAFSEDGLRVAVGYDDGNIDIYEFEPDQVHGKSHPFLGNVNVGKITKKQKDEQESQSQDLFELTQGDEDDFFSHSNNCNPKLTPSYKLPKQFESEIRSLEFLPFPQTNSSKPKSYFLAVATESNPGFVVCDVTSQSKFASYLEDEASREYGQQGVRHASFSPDGTALATIGCDGRLCIWKTSGGDPELDWELMHGDRHKVVPERDTGGFASPTVKSMRPVWSEDGMVLGLPGQFDLQIRKKGDGWKKDRMVLNIGSGEEEKSEIVSMAFDPLNEGYVVTSFKGGNVGIWKLKSHDDENEETPEGEFLGNITTHESPCTHVLWSNDTETGAETLYLALENGSMLVASGRENIIPHKNQKQPSISTSVDEEDEAVETQPDLDLDETQEVEFDTQPAIDQVVAAARGAGADKEKRRLKKVSGRDLDDSDDDLLDDADADTGAQTDNSRANTTNPFIADEADENDDNNDDGNFDDVMASIQDDSREQASADAAGDDATMNQDFNGNDVDANDDDDLYINNHPITKTAYLPEPQAPFAPSSTPLARRRILCWNQHGVITSRESEEMDGSTYRTIDISFVDSASNRPVSFRDPHNYIIGTIGEEGGLFASDLMEDIEEDDDDIGDALLNTMSDMTRAVVKKSKRRRNGLGGTRATGSNIYFHRFDTFGSVQDKDWHLVLPEGERVFGCASGEGWNAVVTSRHFLRLFSSGGLQGPIIWLKGGPVTLVGRGRFVAAIFHEANPLMDGTQKLGYALFDGVTGKLAVEGSVSAIGPGSSLIWAGFSNDMALCVMDEDGMVSMLVASKSEGVLQTTHRWVPLLDTLGLKKSREDTFWPVHIQNGKFICVPLKGVKHPDAARRPLTTSFSMRMPLARGNGRSVAMDEVCVRSNLALENKDFMNEFELLVDPNIDAEEQEDEFQNMLVQVDKVSLKLLFTLLDDGKLENAFDLAKRLHLEKSFDIAMEAADRFGQSKLSDRIYDLKEDRFREEQGDLQVDDEENEVLDDQSIASDSQYAPTVDRDQEQKPRRVSPVASAKRKDREEDFDETDDEDLLEPEPEREPVRRRLNPFAKKRKESPAKAVINSPKVKKSTLSRMSTFSAESRKKSKLSKHLL